MWFSICKDNPDFATAPRHTYTVQNYIVMLKLKWKTISMLILIYPSKLNKISKTLDDFKIIGVWYNQSFMVHIVLFDWIDIQSKLIQNGNETRTPIVIRNQTKRRLPIMRVLIEQIGWCWFDSSKFCHLINLLRPYPRQISSMSIIIAPQQFWIGVGFYPLFDRWWKTCYT